MFRTLASATTTARISRYSRLSLARSLLRSTSTSRASGMTDEADRLLGGVILQLLASAADAWARGDEGTACRLCAGAWRLVGAGKFVDAGANDRDDGRTV